MSGSYSYPTTITEMRWLGPYDAELLYNPGDTVSDDGLIWVNLSTCTGVTPVEGTNWTSMGLTSGAVEPTQIVYGGAEGAFVGSDEFTWDDAAHTLALGVPDETATLVAPNAVAESGDEGGSLALVAGAGEDDTTGGNITLTAGVGGANDGTGGPVRLYGGAGGTVGDAGFALVSGGAALDGHGGDVNLVGGASSDGNGGDIALAPGAGGNGGTNGNVIMTGLPTSASGLPSGAIWRDAAASHVLKMVP